jgi:hypothetical protein
MQKDFKKEIQKYTDDIVREYGNEKLSKYSDVTYSQFVKDALEIEVGRYGYGSLDNSDYYKTRTKK